MKKKLPSYIILLLFLAFALAIGFLGLLLPKDFRTVLSDGLFTPIADAFLRLVNCISLPLIFLSMVSGITGTGNPKQLGKHGKSLLLGFFLVLSLSAVFSAIVSFLACGLKFNTTNTEGNLLKTVSETILDIIPGDWFSPFSTENSLQVIFLAVLLGIFLLLFSEKTKGITKLAEEAYLISQKMMTIVAFLSFVYIFVSLIRLIWDEDFSVLRDLWLPIVIHLVTGFLLLIVLVLFTAKKTKQKVTFVIKAISKLYLTGFTTASATTAIGENYEANDTLGVKREFSSLGLPIGMMICKPMSAMYLATICCYWAKANQIDVSAEWILICILLSVFMTVAIPPVTGGGVNVYVVMFTALNIPIEMLTVTLAVDVFMDHIITAFNVSTQPLVLSVIAKKQNQLQEVTHENA